MFFKYLDRTQTYYSSCEECQQIVTKQSIYCGPNYLKITHIYHSSRSLLQQIFPNYFDILPKQTNFTPNYFHQSQIFESTGIMPHVHLGIICRVPPKCGGPGEKKIITSFSLLNKIWLF